MTAGVVYRINSIERLPRISAAFVTERKKEK